MTSDPTPPEAAEPGALDAHGALDTPDTHGAPGASALLALQRATHATLQLLAAELAVLGLTASEINALANLSDGRARTASELGAAVGTRPTTLTGVLDRLEQRGHITRGARAGDRRSVLVELTASGRQAADTVRRTVTGLEHRALRDLTPAQVDGFHAVLLALTKASA
ncbi:MarR family winged helix-turn-helix transcriptional regulator [Kitasatospora sp. NPDC059408]|uniref:MarR family winged helix-turn-helix transcriptional regulator n=1 Tax=Kitasatospora sp. NPDC059408 TaxID=3346823 RepID=UPI00368B2E03